MSGASLPPGKAMMPSALAAPGLGRFGLGLCRTYPRAPVRSSVQELILFNSLSIRANEVISAG